MLYKKGDKVRIKDNILTNVVYKGENGYELTFVPYMEKFKNRTLTINEVYEDKGVYTVEEDNDTYKWCFLEEMLELVPFNKESFKFGDIITLRNKEKYIFIKNKIISKEGFKYLIEAYDENLNCKDEIISIPELDIMKVERGKKIKSNIYEAEVLFYRKENL